MAEDNIREDIERAVEFGPDDLEPGTVPAFELRLARLPRNDTGNAARFILRRGRDFIWVKDAGWYAWDGKRWNFEEGGIRARLAAQDCAAAIRHEAAALLDAGPIDGEKPEDFEKRIDGHRKFGVNSGNAGKLTAMLQEAEPKLAHAVADFDADPFRFAVANGTLLLGAAEAGDVVPITLYPHDRRDLITRISPVDYRPEIQSAPVFERFLAFALPNADVQCFVRDNFGYAMTGSTEEQSLMLFHGEGKNGKSTLVDIVCWILGDYAMTLPIASLMTNDRKGGSEATPDLARLPGARLVRSAEPKQGAALDESLIKMMTGGEEMTVRHLNQGFFEFIPRFKLLLSFNRRPVIRGDDDGIWRRLRLVPFDQQLDDADIDRTFLKRLQEEGSAILNWMLDGYQAWRLGGLKPPQDVTDATAEYRAESDWLGAFLGSTCVLHRKPYFEGTRRLDEVGALDIYAAYVAWCFRNAVEPRTASAFGRRLGERRGIHKVRSGTVRYFGIELIETGLLQDQAALRVKDGKKP